MTWYYAENRTQVGPVDDAALDALAREGRIQPDTLVWREGMADWQPYRVARPAQAAALLTPGTPTPVAAGGINLGKPADAAPGYGAAPQAAPYGSPQPSPYAPPPPGPGYGPASADADRRFCSECGQSYAAADLVNIGNAQVCARCKPAVMQRLREGVGVPGQQVFAGFWIRVVAKLIDYVILMVVTIPLTILSVLVALPGVLAGSQGNDTAAAAATLGAVLIQLAISVVSLIFWVLYEAWFTTRKGGTPGKLILSLQVVRPDGARLTFGRAVGRTFAQLINSFTFLIGYVIAAFDAQKRALHDMICDTRVVVRR